MIRRFIAISTILTSVFMTAVWGRTLSGVVKDPAGNGVSGVAVMATDSADNYLAYVITDNSGEYALDFPEDATDSIKFTGMGYGSVAFAARNLGDSLAVTMHEEEFVLKEVVVEVAPVRAYGDTLTYNVASFSSASDRTIEDVIRKLPGVSVENNGTILYNGESINKFYIEGMDMLGGRYALATRNISPGDVASVNVYENHQPVKVLKDIQLSDKAALNLKLKRKSMLKPSGHVKAGGGADLDDKALWQGEAFGMFIAPKIQSMVTAKTNNTALRYGAEVANLGGDDFGSETSLSSLFSSTPFGSASIPTERYYNNRGNTASVNVLTKAASETTVSTVADYTDERDSYDNSEHIAYARHDSPDIVFNRTANSSLHSKAAKARVTVEHNSAGKYLSNATGFRGTFGRNAYAVYDNSQHVDQRNRSDSWAVSNTLSTAVRLGSNIVTLRSDIAWANSPVNTLTASGDSASGNVAQSVKSNSFTTRHEASYSYVPRIDVTLGLRAVLATDYSHLQTSDIKAPQRWASDISGTKISALLEPEYQHKIDRTTFKLSVPVALYRLAFENIPDSASRRYRATRPEVTVRGSFVWRAPHNVTSMLSGGRTAQIGGLSSFLMTPVYTVYNSMSTPGSGIVDTRSAWFVNLESMFRNTVKGIFANADIVWRRTESDVLRGLNVASDATHSVAMRSPNTADMIRANVRASKNVYSWHTSFLIDATCEHIEKKVLRNSGKYGMNSDNWILHGNIYTSLLHDMVTVTADAVYGISAQKISGMNFDSSRRDFSASLGLAVRPVSTVELSGRAEWKRTPVAQNLYKNSSFVDCSARYIPSVTWEFELSGRNLSDTRLYSYSIMREGDVYTYSYSLRPLEALATVRYKF